MAAWIFRDRLRFRIEKRSFVDANKQNSVKYTPSVTNRPNVTTPLFLFLAAASKAVRLPAIKIKRIPTPVSLTRDSRPTFRGRDKQRYRVTRVQGGVLATPAWMLNSSLITGLDVKHMVLAGLSNSPLMWGIV